ncbi:MAG: outer membrane beta-barrel protein [Bacteroidota bacterium]
MKITKKSLLTILFLLIAGLAAEAQIIRGGIIAGMNATQVDGDEVFGYHKYGWNLGATAMIPITKKKWFFALETTYSQKGAYQAPIWADSLKDGSYKLNLNYLEVPMLVIFEDKGGLTFGAGASLGRLIKVEEWENGRRDTNTTLKGPYNTNDFDILLDCRFKLYKKLKFNFRYSYSMAKIRNRTYDNGISIWDRKQYNNMLTFRLIWIFNEKIKAYVKKK